MNTIWLSTLAFISLSSVTHTDGTSNLCSLPRTVSLKTGHEGIIECVCHDFTSLYWYFGNDTTDVKPFIYIDNSVRYGPGFTSGEYDINVNGSLVIKNVSSTHGGAYTAFIIEPGNSEPRREMFFVDVEGPEETGVMKTSNYDQERQTANADKVTTVPTEEPRKVSASPVCENSEQLLEMTDIKSFRDDIVQLKSIGRATLALLVIALFVISLSMLF